MKSKKMFLPTVFLTVAVVTIAIYAVVSGIAMKPVITEGEFPFSVTYELDGEEITIRDVYTARYDRNDGYADTKTRVYVGEIKNTPDSTFYTLAKDENGRIELNTKLYADYLMGDPEYDYFSDEAFEPQLLYYDAEETEYTDEATLLEQGVKLIRFEYPTPVENSFVFSHISYCSGEVVLPALLIALTALIVVFIFVRKEKELRYKVIDKISIVLNFLINFTLLPFVTILALLIDINGGGPEFYRQLLYFLPAFFVLCTAASVALRRLGEGKKSLIAQLLVPAVFAVYLAVCGAFGLL